MDEGNNGNKDTRKHPTNLTEYHISKENDLAMRENEMKFSRYSNHITAEYCHSNYNICAKQPRY